MTEHHFCTYFDHNYLPRGMVMLESLHEHCPQAHIHVLCLSEECLAALKTIAYPFVSLLSLAELESADPELAEKRATRSPVEYYFTITPCLPWYLLQKKYISEITYLDADMMFFSSPEPIFEEAAEASVIITPHRFSENLADLIVWGEYNVSWLTFRNTPEGMACLAWYRASCLEWCRDVLEETRFADQKYLDQFPQRFRGVHVIQHLGGGVAPWNLGGAVIERQEDSLMINGRPFIFYHAQGFKHIRGPFYSSGLAAYGCTVHSAIKEHIFLPYARQYKRMAVTSHVLADSANFSGIRIAGKRSFSLVRDCKRTVKEWLGHTLVVCF